MELVVASSSVDDSIACWNLHSGIEQLRYKSCASPPHGLLSVSKHFLASSQLRENPSSSAPIFFWSWDKPQVQVKSFPDEPIGPLVSDSEGFYIIGGGPSGAIYLWETASGKLLKKLNAHYRSVTCLTLSHDLSILISGSEDGSIKVWFLTMVFDDTLKDYGDDSCFITFSEHLLPVTSVILGPGFHDPIIISSSEDRTCKVWSLSKERLLRSITFPSIIDAIAMDLGKNVFYAGGRDGKIYVAALNAEWHSVKNYGKFIMGHLSDHSKAITCLAFSTDGVTLVSGSEDGTVRVWNTESAQMVRLLKHSKAPVSNVLIVRRSTNISQEYLLKPRALDRYIDDEVESIAVMMPRQNSVEFNNISYISASPMIDQHNQIKELQQNASAGSEVERLRLECKRWNKLFKDFRSTYVHELLNGDNLDGK